MALVNSLLFLLSTVAPFQDDVVPFQDASQEWYPDETQVERVLGSFPQRHCGPGEEWSLCLAACRNQRNCSNLDRHIICPPECVSGCTCRDGTVRAPDGLCVYPWQCPAHPAEHDETKDDVPQKVSRQEFKVEDLSSNWIPECGENEHYTLCPRVCPDDCFNYGDHRRVCRFVCRPWPGCQCKAGFVGGPQGACIRPEQCPDVSCEENEEYLDCGTACPKNCITLNENVPCVAMCVPGCFCKRPMVRGPAGKCVLPRECPGPPQGGCGEGEELLECGPPCEPDCSTERCEENRSCRRGCFCRPGLVRGPAGRCLPPSRCPRP